MLAKRADAQAVSDSNEADARAAPPRILILEGPSADWTRRVHGQLSDLPAVLRITASSARPESDPGAMRALARRYKATLVVWIVPALGGPEGGRGVTAVAIWFASSERLYTRPVAGAWSELSSADQSGALELAALSVRSAVRSLLLDSAPPTAAAGAARVGATDSVPSTLGTSSPDRQRETSPDASAADPISSARPSDVRTSASERRAAQAAIAALPPDEAALAAAGPPLPEPIPPAPSITARRAAPTIVEDATNPALEDSAPLDLHWGGEVGLAWQFYGLGAVGSMALQAGLGAGSGAWVLSAFGQFGLPTESRVGPARFDVQRHAVLGEARYAAWTFDAITVAPLARLGLVVLHRSPATANTQVEPLPAANHLALAAGLGFSLEYQLSAWLGVSIRSIVSWQSSSPAFAVREAAGATVSSDSPWRLQPSLDATGKFSW